MNVEACQIIGLLSNTSSNFYEQSAVFFPILLPEEQFPKTKKVIALPY